jgi:proton-dependent oligopeptide transporter, POT family
MATDQIDKSLGLALAKGAIHDEKRSIDAEHLSPDEYIPNSENVTQHEFETLRHVGDTLPYAAWLVVIVEFAER